MCNANGTPTPMLSNYKHKNHGTSVLSHPHLYHSIVGVLQYMSLTRPDIAFSVNKACKFITSSLNSHWETLKWILRYLSGTITHGFFLSPALVAHKVSLCAYNVFDWASDLDDRRSTFGSCTFFSPNLVS